MWGIEDGHGDLNRYFATIESEARELRDLNPLSGSKPNFNKDRRDAAARARPANGGDNHQGMSNGYPDNGVIYYSNPPAGNSNGYGSNQSNYGGSQSSGYNGYSSGYGSNAPAPASNQGGYGSQASGYNNQSTGYNSGQPSGYGSNPSGGYGSQQSGYNAHSSGYVEYGSNPSGPASGYGKPVAYVTNLMSGNPPAGSTGYNGQPAGPSSMSNENESNQNGPLNPNEDIDGYQRLDFNRCLIGYNEPTALNIRHIFLNVLTRNDLMDYTMKIMDCACQDKVVLAIQRDNQLAESYAAQLRSKGYWAFEVTNKTADPQKLSDQHSVYRCAVTTMSFLRDNVQMFKRPSLIINFDHVVSHVKFLERWLNYRVSDDPPAPEHCDVYIYQLCFNSSATSQNLKQFLQSQSLPVNE